MVPTSAISSRGRNWLIAGSFGALALLLLGLAAWQVGPLPGDQAIRSLFLLTPGSGVNNFMDGVSFLGSKYALAPVGGIGFLWLWARWRETLRLWVFLLVGTPIMEGLCKLLVGRPRPTSQALGFPSGHAMATMVIYGLIAWLLWQSDRRVSVRLTIVLSFAVLVLAVGISRIAVDAHWPSDVLGGWLGGFAWLSFGLWAFEAHTQRRS